MAKDSYLEKLAKEIEFYVERDEEVGIELLSRLDKLENYIEKENISTRELLNYPEIISLYRLNDTTHSDDYCNWNSVLNHQDYCQSNNFLEEFLRKTNFLEEVKELRERIKNSERNLTDLQVEQISAFIKYDALEEDKQRFSDYVLQQVVLGNHRFSYDTLKKALTNVIDGVLNTIDSGKYCQVVKNLKNANGEKLAGLKTTTGVQINEEAVKLLYEVGDCDVIETAFHESFHIYQDVRLRRLVKNYYPEDIIKICRGDFFTVLDTLKDDILEEACGRKYYYDNYGVISVEKEANIRAKTAVMGYFDALGILTPYTKEQIDEEIDEELWQQQDKLREFKRKKGELDDLVLENQSSLRKKMISYPMLHMVYIVDDDAVIREKTEEEIKLDYQDLGEHNEEINAVYQKLMANARARKESKADGPTR